MSYATVTSPPYLVLAAEFHDDLPFIWGLLDGARCLFIYDSGAQQLLLNARHLVPADLAAGGNALGATGIVTTHYTTVDELSFGEWRFQNYEAMVSDLAHLEEEFGVEIHGLIGFRQLIHYDWMVDYAAGEIHLWQRFVKTDFDIRARIPIRYSHHLPLVDVEIAGHAFKFLIDTGAAMVLLDRTRKDLVLHAVTELASEQMVSASSTQAEVESGLLSGFTVAGLAFGPSNIKFADLRQLQGQVGDFDGILGYPMLSRYRMVVSWSFHVIYVIGEP